MQPLAFASAGIYSDDLKPEFWTQYFGVQPDHFHLKGEKFITPSGRLSSGNKTSPGAWLFSSKPHIQSDKLDLHIEFLVRKFGLPRIDLPNLLTKKLTRMRFFCYWDNYSGDRMPNVSNHLQNILTKSGVELEIDIYSNQSD